MKAKIDYRHVDRNQLVDFLAEHQVLSAEAVGEVRLYRCLADEMETLIVALADGSGLLISPPARQTVDRRRLRR